MRHRLERDERAAFVERRVDEQRRSSCHACISASVTRPRTCTCSARPRSRPASRARRYGPSPSTTHRHGAAVERAVIAHRRQRAQQDVEALVRFEPADAEQNALVRLDVVRAGAGRRRAPDWSARRWPADRARWESSASGRAGIPRCRRTTGSSARSVAMTASAAAAQVRTARRSGRYAARLSRRARRIGRAELLEPLRVQHERRRCADVARARVAEHARAEPVDDVGTVPARTSSSARRPARRPNSGYAVLRSSTVVPRRPASGNVRYGTNSTRTRGWIDCRAVASCRRLAAA